MPDDQTNRDRVAARPAAAGAHQGELPPALFAMVRRALDDLETLLGTLSARSDKGLAAILREAIDPADPLLASANAFTLRCAELLATPAATIACRNDLLADLIRARDVLNSAAFPASADTYRLTAFYAGRRRLADENGNADLFRAEARSMNATRWMMRTIAAVALLVLAYTIMLSAAALNGRTTLNDNRAIRAELDAAGEMLARLEAPTLAAAFPDVIAGESMRELRIRPCDALSTVLVRAGSTALEVQAFRDPAHVAVCDRWNDRLRRLQVNEAQILEWNRWVDALFLGIRARVTEETRIGSPDPAKVLAVSERAVAARIDDIAALLMPLHGFLGAAAFVFRRLMQKVQNAELDATEIRQTVIRLALGTILGGVIGLFFAPDGPALNAEGLPIKALGLSALALLAGYAVELVFTFFDFIIRALFVPLKAGAPAQAAPGK
ncbi:MAG: hypothetical protein SNJ73_02330 [Acetobacteraceae bacterium]